jgi:putative glutamine amidotransferase
VTGPLIGVPAYLARSEGDTPSPYLAAVAHAGGEPIPFPFDLEIDALRRLFDRVDGLLLTGGGDIDPRLYGAASSSSLRDVDPRRDRTELILARWALEHDKPVLGICRGLQVINVALGGTLIQDIAAQIPGALPHDLPDEAAEDLAHRVDIKPGSRLHGIARAGTAEVNSSHHQAVLRVAGGLRMTASAPDGVVEAIEAPGLLHAVAVQWHPERLPNRLESRSLFAGLTRAAGRGYPQDQ